MPRAPADLATFEANATMVADILRALANERRLMLLCKLVEWGETGQMFTSPKVELTGRYLNGEFG